MQNSINTEYVTEHTLMFPCYLSVLPKSVLNWLVPQSLALFTEHSDSPASHNTGVLFPALDGVVT